MVTKLVSAIVPVYNVEKKLSYCVESLLHQKYGNIEIILVDDGSPDKSGEICDWYANNDNRVSVVHTENKGVSSARNTGIDIAKGEYLVFVDSDDYVEPEYILELVDTIEHNSDIGHVWCCFQTVSGYQYENKSINYNFEENLSLFGRKDIMTLHEMWLDASPCNKIFRREVIASNNIRFDPALSLGEDWMFNLEYLDTCENERIIVIKKALYNYVRIGNDSQDTKYRENILDIYHKLNGLCKNYLVKWNVSVEQMSSYYNSCFYSYEKVLRNTFKSNVMPRHEMYRWNNTFIRSTDFQTVLENSSCFIHPLFRLGYKLGDYHIINMVDSLHRYKKSVLDTLRELIC